jgi:hypothetical protein
MGFTKKDILMWILTIFAAPVFFVFLHVAIGPTGQLSIVFTSHTLLLAGLGFLAAAVPFWLAGVVLCISKRGSVAEHGRSLASCLLLLYAFPLAIMMHPLGVPRSLLVLFQPRIILLFAAAMMLLTFSYKIVSPFLGATSKWIFSRSSRTLAWVLFLLLLSIYALLILQNDRVRRLVGDEPHYLMIMESLRRHQTADLRQLVESDAALPHGIRIVNLHTSGQSRPGTLYEVHNVGTAIVMLPAFVVFGYKGAIGMFAVFTAFLISNLYLLCEDVTRQRWLSWSVALMVGLSAPFFFYFRFIYPEIPATACALFAFRIMRKTAPSAFLVLMAGVAAAAMPWFHAKFTVIAATLMLLHLWLHRGAWKRVAMFAFPFIPSALLLMMFFYRAYGSWLPNAQYGGDYETINSFFFRGSLGLLMDPDNGLIPFAPVYMLMIPGMVLLWSHNRQYALQSLLITVPSFIIVSSHWMWWGGPCPPARFIIPFIPFWVPGMVAAMRTAYHQPALRFFCLILLASTLAISYVSLDHVDHLHVPRHFLRDQFLGLAAYFPFPSFYIHRSQAVPVPRFIAAGAWIVIFVGLTLWFRFHRGNELGQTKPRHYFQAFILILGIPGGIALMLEALEQRSIYFRDSGSATLAQMNYVLDAYYRPIARSRAGLERQRISPVSLNVEIPINTKFDLDATLFQSGHPDRWLYFGQYMVFYPCSYELSLDLIAAPFYPHKPAIYFDAASLKGRIKHFEEKLLIDADLNVPVPAQFRLEPAEILLASEFRVAALQPGRYELNRLVLKVTVQ